MADESSVAAGKRFSRDMRLIREEQDLSIDEIHMETRISRSLLESFEQGGLYDHPTFNEVYLRSFVRAYAEAIDISPDVVLNGLEAALEGTYERELADQYLESVPGEEKTSTPSEGEGAASDAPDLGASSASTEESDGSSSAPPDAGGAEGRGGIVGAPRALGDEEETDSEDSSESDPPSASPEPSDSEESTEPQASQSPAEDAQEEATAEASPPSSEADDGEAIDKEESDGEEPEDASDSSEDAPAWMEERPEEEEESPPAAPSSPSAEPSFQDEEGGPSERPAGETGIVGEPTAVGEEDLPSGGARSAGASAALERGPQRSPHWTRFFPGEQREILWAGLGMVVIVLVLVGLSFAYFSVEEDPSEERVQAGATLDTAATSSADTTASAPQPPPANVKLEETIYLTVLATAPVTGIRIQRDEDLERPYWIEEGEAEVYPFQRRVTLEEELGDIRLFLAGYPYLDGQQDTTGQIVITRSRVEAFVDTLRGPPATLSVTPDTIPKGPPERGGGGGP